MHLVLEAVLEIERVAGGPQVVELRKEKMSQFDWHDKDKRHALVDERILALLTSEVVARSAANPQGASPPPRLPLSRRRHACRSLPPSCRGAALAWRRL